MTIATVDASLPPAASQAPALLPEIAGPSPVEPANPELKLALDRAFTEPDRPPLRHTHAVVVLKDGRVVAERYAPGYGIDTPILGYSATKSVISALTGILVRQGRLAVDEPAPVAAWQSPDDPHHAITVDHLLRHTSGLAMGSSLNASLLSAIAPVNQMKFIAHDMAAFAEGADLESTPGSAWNYHDGNTIILSHLIRDAAGGSRRRRAALCAQRAVRPARHAQRHAGIRRRRHPGRIEPDAGFRARLGAVGRPLSQ